MSTARKKSLESVAEAARSADEEPAMEGIPTLSDAFTLTALALLAHYDALDNAQLCLHLEGVQRMHADGNVLIAWSQLIPLLEDALGGRLVLP